MSQSPDLIVSFSFRLTSAGYEARMLDAHGEPIHPLLGWCADTEAVGRGPTPPAAISDLCQAFPWDETSTGVVEVQEGV